MNIYQATTIIFNPPRSYFNETNQFNQIESTRGDKYLCLYISAFLFYHRVGLA